ncbi:50S ribosomal protein L17 [Candidatus Parcubacteria bacterium]|nr:50S ribosomal protein L17 [Patescibacteria group bacterium]MCG2686738.1 50S ribosomal protein L17 [Candidatus Parcubacteria bacterium]
MRHQRTKRTLGRKTGPRKALLKNLLQSLILYEKIKTTGIKAKEIKPLMEKMVTCAKNDTLHNRREIMKIIPTNKAVSKLFEVLGRKYKERKGGYLRIVKLGERKGDGASMAQIEFV